jgi:hypothetical protein
MMATEPEKPEENDQMPPPRQAIPHLPQHEWLLLEYLDGALAEPLCASLEQHVATCAECRALSQDWQQLNSRLSAGLGRPRLSPQFAKRLWAKIERESALNDQATRRQLREALEADFARDWADFRKRFLRAQVPVFLDWLGYTAVAAIGGYFLFGLLLKTLRDFNAGSLAVDPQCAFTLGTAAGLICLLAGLGIAGKNQLSRWLAEL